MKGKTKAALAGLGGLLTVGWLVSRAKAAPAPPEEEVVGVGLSIEILGPDGQPVPHNSPATVVEGRTYTLRAIVTNISTQAGQPVPATFTVKVRSPAPMQDPLDASRTSYLTFSPSQTSMQLAAQGQQTFDATFTPAIGTYAESGPITVDVFRPDGAAVASASLSVLVVAQLAGTMSPGLVYWSGLADWTSYRSDLKPPYGAALYLAPSWLNGSTSPIAGTVVLTAISPSGVQTTPTATQNQGKTANPGDGWGVAFSPIALNEVGVWHFRAQLYTGPTFLAEVSYTLEVVAAPIVYGVTVTVGVV